MLVLEATQQVAKIDAVEELLAEAIGRSRPAPEDRPSSGRSDPWRVGIRVQGEIVNLATRSADVH